MILDKNIQDKPDINYPTDWGFKLIGRDKDELEKCIKEGYGRKRASMPYRKYIKRWKVP